MVQPVPGLFSAPVIVCKPNDAMSSRTVDLDLDQPLAHAHCPEILNHKQECLNVIEK